MWAIVHTEMSLLELVKLCQLREENQWAANFDLWVSPQTFELQQCPVRLFPTVLTLKQLANHRLFHIVIAWNINVGTLVCVIRSLNY